MVAGRLDCPAGRLDCPACLPPRAVAAMEEMAAAALAAAATVACHPYCPPGSHRSRDPGGRVRQNLWPTTSDIAVGGYARPRSADRLDGAQCASTVLPLTLIPPHGGTFPQPYG